MSAEGKTGGAGSGTVTITIGGNNAGGNAARVAIGWETSDPTDSNDLWHRITMIDSSGVSTTQNIGVGGGTTSFTLAEGSYTVMVSGWLSTGNDISAPATQLKSAGRATVDVPANGSTHVDVTMKHSQQPVVVTFAHNSGTSGGDQYQYIAPGETPVPLAAARDGHTLAGWYAAAVPLPAATAFNFGTGISANTTIYAKWTVPVADPAEAGLYKKNAAGTWDPITLTGASFVTEAVNKVNNDFLDNGPGEFRMVVGAGEAVGTRTLSGAGLKLTIRAAGTGTLTERVIELSGDGRLFVVQNGAELTLDAGITLQGHAGNNTCLVQVATGSMLTMKEGATIRDNKNTVSLAGGVHMNGGSFDMLGGTISGNSATSGGGGVFFSGSGTFAISGGTIEGNTADLSGGGVYFGGTGTFAMSGDSAIKGANSADFGGGVYFSGTGTFTMSDESTIEGNTADTSGGGVYVTSNGSFEMQGDTILGNTAANGGGVYAGSDATFNKTGGTIYGKGEGGNSNTAASDGDGHTAYVSLTPTPLYKAGTAGSSHDMYYSPTAPTADIVGWDNSGTTTKPTNAGLWTVTESGGTTTYTPTGVNASDLSAVLTRVNSGGGSYLLMVETVQPVTSQLEFSSTATLTIEGVAGIERIIFSSNITDGNLFKITGGGHLILDNNIVLEGHTGADASLVRLEYISAKLTMKGTSRIRNNETAFEGGGVYVAAGEFIMDGGTISSNIAREGGGVYVGNGKFTMNNGTISGNTAEYNGGGVYIWEDGTFIKTAGTIYGSKTTGNVDEPVGTRKTADGGPDQFGHAVYVEPPSNLSTYYYRDLTADEYVPLNSTTYPPLNLEVIE